MMTTSADLYWGWPALSHEENWSEVDNRQSLDTLRRGRLEYVCDNGMLWGRECISDTVDIKWHEAAVLS